MECTKINKLFGAIVSRPCASFQWSVAKESVGKMKPTVDAKCVRFRRSQKPNAAKKKQINSIITMNISIRIGLNGLFFSFFLSDSSSMLKINWVYHLCCDNIWIEIELHLIQFRANQIWPRAWHTFCQNAPDYC